MTSSTGPEIEAVLRPLVPRVLATLVRRHGGFDECEDAVQEAMIAASTQWLTEGVPQSPQGWLITVASRRLADHQRSEIARRRREAAVAEQGSRAGPPDRAPEEAIHGDYDDTLTLLFLCCHPSLTAASQVALTLRAVGGLTTAEIAGLLALMLLIEARRPTRTDPAGDLVPLTEQDRSRWDADLITEGVALLTASLPVGPTGPYQLQAAIAALHDEAAHTDDTDWPQILALYELLRRLAPSPTVELNAAVAAAMVHGPAAGLARIADLDPDTTTGGRHRVEATRAHLLDRAGDVGAAAAYRRAAELTDSEVERRYLLGRAARVSDPASRAAAPRPAE